MNPTLLRILHAVGLTDLTDDEVRAYRRLHRRRPGGDGPDDANDVTTRIFTTLESPPPRKDRR